MQYYCLDAECNGGPITSAAGVPQHSDHNISESLGLGNPSIPAQVIRSVLKVSPIARSLSSNAFGAIATQALAIAGRETCKDRCFAVTTCSFHSRTSHEALPNDLRTALLSLYSLPIPASVALKIPEREWRQREKCDNKGRYFTSDRRRSGRKAKCPGVFRCQ
jgi:hypothetical protein